MDFFQDFMPFFIKSVFTNFFSLFAQELEIYLEYSNKLRLNDLYWECSMVFFQNSHKIPRLMCQANLEEQVKNDLFAKIMNGCSTYFKLLAGAMRDPKGLNRLNLNF